MGRPLGDGGRRGVGVASCQCFRLTGPRKFWPQVTFVQAPKSCLSHSEPPLPSRDIGTLAAEAWSGPLGEGAGLPQEPRVLPWLPQAVCSHAAGLTPLQRKTSDPACGLSGPKLLQMRKRKAREEKSLAHGLGPGAHGAGPDPCRCRDGRARSAAWPAARARVLGSEHCAEPELPSAHPARGHMHGDPELSGSRPGPAPRVASRVRAGPGDPTQAPAPSQKLWTGWPAWKSALAKR